MDILLTELQFDDIAIRKKAASYINRLSRGAWTDKNKEYLINVKTISILIDAIEQEIDEKILLDLLNTVGSISQRYEYYDLRILETFVPFYDHASICIKVEACTKTLQFNDPRTWHAIYKIFEHKTTKKTNQLLGLFIARYAENIPEEFIVRLSPFIQNAFLKEKNLDAKDNLLLSLGKVGNYETIEFINKQVLNTKTDALLKERARYTIQEIVERLG